MTSGVLKSVLLLSAFKIDLQGFTFRVVSDLNEWLTLEDLLVGRSVLLSLLYANLLEFLVWLIWTLAALFTITEFDLTAVLGINTIEFDFSKFNEKLDIKDGFL